VVCSQNKLLQMNYNDRGIKEEEPKGFGSLKNEQFYIYNPTTLPQNFSCVAGLNLGLPIQF